MSDATDAQPSDPLRDAALAWIAADPDPETREELQRVVDSGDRAALEERMGSKLEFGTAGLRGIVGAGANRMNHAVVLRTTRGLADYVRRRVPDWSALPVVVGFDGRTTSRAFAEDAVGVLAAAGLSVRYFDTPVPTPLVAYAARQLAASAAVVVTASHNPPEYNGYKVFASNAAQIVPPVDAQIAASIDGAGPAREIKKLSGAMSGKSERAEPVAVDVVERYFHEVDAVRPKGPADRGFTIAYTPLHGVGWPFVRRALELAGFSNVVVVEDQAEPDGTFPTVAFPNPEEKGAMDGVLALAESAEAELVLANDPDADRLAVAVPTPTGRFIQLTGNQVGILLADFVLETADETPTPLVISSIVSSPMLKDIAESYGARYERTLTGFKWICNAALDLEEAGGTRFVFGYEEALGYSVGKVVRDKDGVSAAVLFAELAARCRALGESVLDRLHRVYRRHGLWVSVQKSLVRPGAEGKAEIAGIMARLGEQLPERVGSRDVTDAVDYRRDAEKRPRWLAESPLVALELAGGARILIRPSGTEPKLKIYVDLRVEVGDSAVGTAEKAALAEARALAEETAAALGLDGSA